MRTAVPALRQAVRLLTRHRRFTALAIGSLGVAIALNTTMYGVLDAMIRPELAIRNPHQLYTLPYFGDFRRLIPSAEKNDAIRRLRFHQGVAGRVSSPERIAERGRRLREVSAVVVTPDYFRVLAPTASAGRLIGPADLSASVAPVVISERLWRGLFPEQDRFEAGIIRFGGAPRLVVGVLPHRAGFPGDQIDLWQLPAPSRIDSIPLWLARLRDAVTPAQADVELAMLSGRFSERTGENPREAGFRFRSATQPPYRTERFHFALIGAVVAVLLVACANLANLQLARGVTRARELATRAALGASRWHIVGQLLVESALLAFGGLLLAVVLAWWGVQLIDAYLPPSLEGYVTRPQVSWRVGAFAVGVTVLSLVLVGLLPAVRLSRVDINDVLKSGAGTGQTRSARRQYAVLVVFEVAVALALLNSASLLLNAAYQVHAFEYGYETDGLLYAFVGMRGDAPAGVRSRRDWSDRIVQRALTVPGVRSAATVSWRNPPRRAISVDDPGGAARVFTTHTFAYREVTPDYFRTTAIPVLRGRDFAPGEFAEPQIIIEERAANLFWPGLDPVGRLMKLDSAHSSEPWLRVVGVAREVREWFPRNRDEPETVPPGRRRGLGTIYALNADPAARARAPASRPRDMFLQLVVRVDSAPARVAMELRQQLLELAPNAVVGYPQTADQRNGVAALRARHDFMAALFALFATCATALAGLGVYAIIAHMVAQRSREFGVRIAVGAAERDIRRMVLREGNLLALVGIAIGLVITWQNASLVRAFVFSDYDRYDSRFFAAATVTLFAIALLASYVPARRAMRIDPVEALRND